MSIIIWGSIMFVGDVAISNQLPLNGSIATDYYILSGNLTAAGKIANTSLFKPIVNIQAQQSALQSELQSGSVLQAGVTSLTLIASYFSSLPILFWTFTTNLIAAPFQALGFQYAFAIAMGQLLLVILIILGIISMIFLFPA